MQEAREIELTPIAERVGGLDLVVISANDPEAMLRHTEECRQRGYPFPADPQPAARLDGRRRHPAADRRRDLPVHQRVRGRADRAEDRLVRGGDPRPGRHPGHHPRAQGRPDRPQGRADRSRSSARPRSARPTRPGSATRSGPASWPASPGARPRALPPRSAACWPPTSSRPSAPRSTSSGRRASSTGSARRTARTRSPTSSRTCAARAPEHRAGEPPVDPGPSRWQFDLSGRDRPGDDFLGVGADLEPATLLAAYRAGLSRCR